jgi:hypothetical protein
MMLSNWQRCKTELPLAFGERVTFLCLCKEKSPKETHPGKAPSAHPALQVPCASRLCGVAQTVHPCTASPSRRSIAATLRACPAKPAMLGALQGPRFAASMPQKPQPARFTASSYALRAGARGPWGPCAAASAWRKARRVARTMRASSLHVHGCTFSEPRSALADSEGRMPGERGTGVCFFRLPFFAQAKKGDTLACKASGSSDRY